MATKSIGSSSRDYATLSAWGSYVNALTLSAPEVGEMYNDAEFTESSTVTIGGWSGGSSTNTVTLKCAAGQSFRDNANVLTNALRYNQSNGVGVASSKTYANCFEFTSTYTIIDGIQWRTSGSNNEVILLLNADNVTLQNFVVQGKPRTVNQYCVLSNLKSGVLIQNGGILVKNSTGSGLDIPTSTTVYDVTIVSNASSTGNGMACAYSPGPTVKNCAVYGFSTDYSGTCGSSDSNATDKSSFGGTGWGTNGQASITSAEWQSLTVNSEDFRLSTNSTKLLDNGAAAGPTTDIAGTARPQRSAYDIGCWELITFKPTSQTNGDELMYNRNTADQYLGFGLINANTGAPLAGATVSAVLSIDGGTQTGVGGTVNDLGNGQYSLALSQGDTNGGDISFLFTAMNAVPVEKTITTAISGAAPIALHEFKGQGTFTLTVPSYAKRAFIGTIGAGGGGAGSTASTDKVCGGGGGAYCEDVKTVTTGESLTFTNGAAGIGGLNGNGTAGGNSTVTASSSGWTMTANGGAAGTRGTTTQSASGGSASGGAVNSSGGGSGAVSSANNASGGGAPGHPYGNGALSGACSTSGIGASGGAGLKGASGSLLGTATGATGGGGVETASGSLSSGTAGTNGGGIESPSALGQIVAGVTYSSAPNSISLTPGGLTPAIYAALYATQGVGGPADAMASGTNMNASPGGGGGALATPSSSGAGGSGGMGGGGGGGHWTSISAFAEGGAGGMFGGGGASVTSGNAGGTTAGTGGLGGGGGGAASTTGSSTGGGGGDGYSFCVFLA